MKHLTSFAGTVSDDLLHTQGQCRLLSANVIAGAMYILYRPGISFDRTVIPMPGLMLTEEGT